MPLTLRMPLLPALWAEHFRFTHILCQKAAPSHTEKARKVNKLNTTTVTRREAEKQTIKNRRGQERGKEWEVTRRDTLNRSRRRAGSNNDQVSQPRAPIQRQCIFTLVTEPHSPRSLAQFSSIRKSYQVIAWPLQALSSDLCIIKTGTGVIKRLMFTIIYNRDANYESWVDY